MSLVGLDKFRKNNLVKVPPEVDDKGESTEVQVLEEFNPDQFLDQLKKTRSHLPALLGAHAIRECANPRR